MRDLVIRIFNAMLAAFIAVDVVLGLCATVILYVGTGRYDTWHLRTAIVLVALPAIIVMTSFQLRFTRGRLKGFRKSEEFQVIVTLLPVAASLGILINIVTGRGELVGYGVVLQVLFLVAFAGSLMTRVAVLLIAFIHRVLSQLNRPRQPDRRKLSH